MEATSIAFEDADMIVGAGSNQSSSSPASKWDKTWLSNVLHQRRELHDMLVEARNAVDPAVKISDADALLEQIKGSD